MTKDPVVGQVGGMSIRWNAYAYAGNNPVNYVDPDGQFFWFVLGAAGIAAVAATVGAAAWELFVEQGVGVGGRNQGNFDCVDWDKVMGAGAAGFMGALLGLSDLLPPVALARLAHGVLNGLTPDEMNRNFFDKFGHGATYDDWSQNPYFRVGQGVGSVTSLLVGLWQLAGAMTSGQFVNGIGNIINGGGGGAAGTAVNILTGVNVGQLTYGLVTTAGGVISTNHWAFSDDNGEGGGGQKPELTPQQQKSIRSLQKQVEEHQAKLEAYRNNPDAFDNQGYLKNAPDEATRQRIINGRIRHLESEIKAFQDQIDKILKTE